MSCLLHTYDSASDAVESISDSDLMNAGLRAKPSLSASHQSVPTSSLRVHAKWSSGRTLHILYWKVIENPNQKSFINNTVYV